MNQPRPPGALLRDHTPGPHLPPFVPDLGPQVIGWYLPTTSALNHDDPRGGGLSTHGSGYPSVMSDEAVPNRMGRLRRLAYRADAAQQRHPWSALLAGVIRKFGDDRAGGLAALIAYYGFFSLFPLLLLVVTVTSYALHGNEQLQTPGSSIPRWRTFPSSEPRSAAVSIPSTGARSRSSSGSSVRSGVGWHGRPGGGRVRDGRRLGRAAQGEGVALPRLLRGAIVLVVLATAVLLAAMTASISAVSSSSSPPGSDGSSPRRSTSEP